MKMDVKIREFENKDIHSVPALWNKVVADGNAFPQTETLDEQSGIDFFNMQSFTGVAENENGEIIGLYILHPNNVGRCGHICNASYAVKSDLRGRHIGEKLVKHCIKTAKELGFKILQFNAVVKTNTAALNLYNKLGFVKLGVIPNGFLMPDGTMKILFRIISNFKTSAFLPAFKNRAVINSRPVSFINIQNCRCR